MSPRKYHHPETDEITLARVLAALSDPTRLEMIRRLADGLEHDSLELADDLPRSTLTYHTRMLRESGVTWTRSEGRACLIRLRSEDLDRLFPGVLSAVVANTVSTEVQE
ncbi:Transcriptional regulator [Corynebacterium jeikeium]|jgi:DNA-binding transcriptional ArsR family regulator|uniref:ArsR/SmtB family transcription factor n=1 Tax=Corynebacterium TaxID=1716 RepID=UPI0001B718A9|nr:helix-turn-helix domain-containing protein [Corynebacterium jeikeium]EEW17068.1 transcriptional regulator, ArsR family [Corynebacterium jeikeium ATCC 43734]OOD30018.1 transcriptional regulator [Corynebacterium jeikeium]WCZ53330.1 Helix-turn-helix domain protein [Corynebacterium jeikeium]SQI21837.1 predicted transcriptional regulator [Corynebacterium jeikeium]SUY81359.1 predicted transcriptional regulator [Corynebacterium jeikeium]